MVSFNFDDIDIHMVCAKPSMIWVCGEVFKDNGKYVFDIDRRTRDLIANKYNQIISQYSHGNNGECIS
jgi:hypothetical protein